MSQMGFSRPRWGSVRFLDTALSGVTHTLERNVAGELPRMRAYEGSAMDDSTCIKCGLASGYNRAVVSLPREDSKGGLCRECEAQVFGEILSETAYRDGTCTMCNRDGFYALPRWQPFEREEDGKVIVCNRIDITESTPTLCDEDFHQLLVSDTESGGPDLLVQGGTA